MPAKAPPRLYVLTPAKSGEIPHSYLLDRDRFLMEPGPDTMDLAKARAWKYPPGVRRFLKRNPVITGYRRVWVPLAAFEAAKKADKAAGASALPIPAELPTSVSQTHRGRASIRSTKTDPNKRAKRATRKRAVRSLRTVLGKGKGATGRKGQKSRKVA